MNGLTAEDARYQPYLLQRLSDFAPDEKSERPESLPSANVLKEDIFENLDMIFNSRSHAGPAELKGMEEVEDSVLGFGLPDFCGQGSSSASREALAAAIHRQLRLFEPRLDSASIEIEPFDLKDGGIGSLAFRISAPIRTKELHDAIAFVCRLDIESGNAQLRFESV